LRLKSQLRHLSVNEEKLIAIIGLVMTFIILAMIINTNEFFWRRLVCTHENFILKTFVLFGYWLLILNVFTIASDKWHLLPPTRGKQLSQKVMELNYFFFLSQSGWVVSTSRNPLNNIQLLFEILYIQCESAQLFMWKIYYTYEIWKFWIIWSWAAL
jgi:hypothetical protein